MRLCLKTVRRGKHGNFKIAVGRSSFNTLNSGLSLRANIINLYETIKYLGKSKEEFDTINFI